MQTHHVELPYLPNMLDLESGQDRFHGQLDGTPVMLQCTPRLHREIARRVRASDGSDVTLDITGELGAQGFGPRTLRATGRA